MIEFTCPGCQTRHKVPEEKAGKKGMCQKCGQAITVPLPASGAEALPLAETVAAPAGVPVAAEAGAEAAGPARRRAPPPLFTPDPPAYRGVQFFGGLFVIVGYGGVALGTLLLLMGIGMALVDREITPLLISVGGVGLVVWGLVLIGVGQLFHCVRDLARNSFWLHRL